MKYRIEKNDDYVFGAGEGEFLVNSPETVAQAIKTRLNLWQGQWFLNTQQGVPYLQSILGKRNLMTAEREIANAILETPGVKKIEALSVSIQARRVSVNAIVVTLYGTTKFNEVI
jgi:hypothetical protein